MKDKILIGIIGDFDLKRPAHKATNEAIQHCARHLDLDVSLQWVPTENLEQNPDKQLKGYDGIWCSPGSPYNSMLGAITGIQYARENDIPFIGTCGGFQHAVLEYIRNILGFHNAGHPEYDTTHGDLFITALSCSLLGETKQIYLKENTMVLSYYKNRVITERYNCNFGVNPTYQKLLDEHGFIVAGMDEQGEARLMELPEKRFYVASLFQPQLSSTPDNPHPLILSYLTACREYHDSK
ncbi:MAG: synthase [Herbinix sp.]|jgi:CTP synthase (UTP-ammonia lyase)|nr:synthase [Herbinix sp.]